MPSNQPYPLSGTVFQESRPLSGVDLLHDPQDLTGNLLLQADNVLNNRTPGVLSIRPGKQGLWGGAIPSSSGLSSSSSQSLAPSSSSSLVANGGTYSSVLGGYLYDLCDFWDDNGNPWLLLTCNGKIYKTTAGGSYYTEILNSTGASFNITSSSAFAARAGDYTYVVYGSGGLIRIDLDGGSVVTGLTAPTVSPFATLTNVTLATMRNASNWSFDGATTAFSDLVSAVGAQSFWTSTWWVQAAGTNWGGSGFNGQPNGTYIDVVVGGVVVSMQSGKFFTVPTYKNSNLHPKRFYSTLQVYKPESNNYNFAVEILAYDSGQNYLTNYSYSPSSISSGWTNLEIVADFSGVATEICYLKYQVNGAPANGAVKSGDCWISYPTITPISVQVSFSAGSQGIIVYPTESGITGALASSSSSVSPSSSSSLSPSSSSSGTVPPFVPEPSLGYDGIYDFINTSLYYTIPVSSSSSSSRSSSSSGSHSSSSSNPYASGGSGLDLTAINRLIIGLAGVASWENLEWNVYLNQGNNFDGNGFGTNFILADAGATITTDNTGLSVDISTIPLANRNDVTQVKLQFIVNPSFIAPYELFEIGPISSAGNLSVSTEFLSTSAAAGYEWYASEISGYGTADPLESNPSPVSNELLASLQQAAANVVPAAATNTEADGFRIYRIGGTNTVTYLVATVSLTADSVDPDTGGSLWSWSHATRTFFDNVPDTDLYGNTVMAADREPPPTNCQAIAAWSGRLWLATGTSIWASWLIDDDNNAALYYSSVNDTNDPYLLVEGWTDPVGLDSTDTVVSLAKVGTPVASSNQFGGALVVMNKRSIGVIQGNDPTSFEYVQYPYAEGVGLIAPRAHANLSAEKLVFAGPDRLHMFPPHYDGQDMGMLIKRAIYPNAPDSTMNAGGMSQAWMEFWDNQLFFGVPTPVQPTGGSSGSSSSSLSGGSVYTGSSTAPSVIWVYNLITEGWTRLLQMNVTGARALPPGSVTGADYRFFLYGQDGQMYQLTGSYDTTGALDTTGEAIAINVTVHAMRPAFFYRLKAHTLLYRWGHLKEYLIEACLTGQMLITLSGCDINGLSELVADPARTWIDSFTMNGTDAGFRHIPMPGCALGQIVTLNIQGSFTTPGYIKGVRGEIAESIVQM